MSFPTEVATAVTSTRRSFVRVSMRSHSAPTIRARRPPIRTKSFRRSVTETGRYKFRAGP